MCSMHHHYPATHPHPLPFPHLPPSAVEECASLAVASLAPLAAADWTTRARAMTWSCRTTLDHIADTLLFYSAHVATLATSRRLPLRNGNADHHLDIVGTLQVLQSCAAIFARLCAQMPPGSRAFHPSGMADASGYISLACEEILLHTWDITAALGAAFRPPDDLCRRITARTFPWGPQGADVDAWDALRWSAGRIALPDRPQLGTDWWYWVPPLEEWDGTQRHARTSPPQWS